MSLLTKLYPDDEKNSGGNDWTLMYGDLMTLLLTFFVMLVSMSELKQNEKFQGIADSMAEQFGGERPSETDSERLGRSAGLAMAHKAYSTRRSKELDHWDEYVQLVATWNARPSGIAIQNRQTPAKSASFVPAAGSSSLSGGMAERSVTAIPGPRVLAAVQFLPESVDLNERSKQDLREVWESLDGRRVRLEVRGILPAFQRPESGKPSPTGKTAPQALNANENAMVLARAMTVRDLLATRRELSSVRVSLSLTPLEATEGLRLGEIPAGLVVSGNVLVSVFDEGFNPNDEATGLRTAREYRGEEPMLRPELSR